MSQASSIAQRKEGKRCLDAQTRHAVPVPGLSEPSLALALARSPRLASPPITTNATDGRATARPWQAEQGAGVSVAGHKQAHFLLVPVTRSQSNPSMPLCGRADSTRPTAGVQAHYPGRRSAHMHTPPCLAHRLWQCSPPTCACLSLLIRPSWGRPLLHRV